MKNTGNIPFIAEDVSLSSVVKYIDQCREQGVDIHAFELYEENQLKVRFAPYPYSCQDSPQIYSLSKSFTATAIGMLCDEGRLCVEDRIVDIFPDKLPETVSDHLKEMKIKHVLSMNTGHSCCVMNQMNGAGDSVKAFLAQPVPNKPGTSFVYNTGATSLLASVVEKVTGKSHFDFVSERIFEPLDIVNVYWDQNKDGTSEGGTGLHISCDDVAKFGLLYLNGGVWNGQRLLSEEWVKTASAAHSDNSMNGTPDWSSGYGYQFWKNAKWGYRGDGAMGQLCLILPEKQIVAVQFAFLYQMQPEMDLLCELIENLHADTGEQPDVSKAMAGYYVPFKSNGIAANHLGKTYFCDKNPADITSFTFTEENEKLVFTFSNGREKQKIVCGNGEFVQNKIWARNIKPTLRDILVNPRYENLHFMASFESEDDKITIQFRYLDCPVTETVVCTFFCGESVLSFDSEIGVGAGKIRAVLGN